MKPYSKTFRSHKDHKADKCKLCAEQVANAKTAFRQKLAEGMKDFDQEYSQAVDENFWDLIEE